MERKFPEIPVNIIANRSHCYVEVKLGNNWHQFCLGGVINSTNPLVKAAVTSDNCAKKLLARKHGFFQGKKNSQQGEVVHNPTALKQGS